MSDDWIAADRDHLLRMEREKTARTTARWQDPTALYDDRGRFIGHAIEVPHHTTGSRAWCLKGLPEWCYPQIPCDSCQRARQGDPWEIIERLTAEVEALRASVQRVRELHAPIDDPDTEPEDRWCVECVKGWDGEDWSRVQWPCATIRASIWHEGNADGADDVGDER